MGKIESLQAARDSKNMERHSFEMIMPICGERVAINGYYVTYYGNLSSYHIEHTFIATTDWQKINRIHDAINHHLMAWFGQEMGGEA